MNKQKKILKFVLPTLPVHYRPCNLGVFLCISNYFALCLVSTEVELIPEDLAAPGLTTYGNLKKRSDLKLGSDSMNIGEIIPFNTPLNWLPYLLLYVLNLPPWELVIKISFALKKITGLLLWWSYEQSLTLDSCGD